jgi:integrase/recombinase XerD
MLETMNLQDFNAKFAAELRRMNYPYTNISVLTGKSQELVTFAMSQNIWEYSIDLGMNFLSTWYPIKGEFKVFKDINIHTRNAYWAIGMMNDLFLHGVFTTSRRSRLVPLSAQNEKLLWDYEAFQVKKGFSILSATRYRYNIRHLLIYLDSNKIKLENIGEEEIIGFLSIYIDKSKQYLQTLVNALKRFAVFAEETNLIKSSVLHLIPSVSKISSPRIPSVWADGDVDKLLESVDRGSPLGKRDYAILSLAAKLGLRTGDICALSFSNIDWENKRIDLIQRKTGKPLSLPLPDDVGWAIIDYLKNGRPQADFPNIFLRHVPPIKPFSEFSSMGDIISRYRTIAGIDIGERAKRGMHSLRHTFATRLLREKVPLETIAEMLGHVGMSSVDIYLSVETEELRRCALNPDEVYANA